MIIEGTIKCEKCGNEINWFYYKSEPYPEALPSKRISVRKVSGHVGDKKYHFNCYCKECGHLNIFDYDKL